jgi:hypothetical protein
LGFAPVRTLADVDPEGKEACGEIHAAASRNAFDREAYRTLPCSERTNAHGALITIAKRDPVAMVDASKRLRNSSIAEKPISALSTKGSKTRCGSNNSAANTSQQISSGDLLA